MLRAENPEGLGAIWGSRNQTCKWGAGVLLPPKQNNPGNSSTSASGISLLTWGDWGSRDQTCKWVLLPPKWNNPDNSSVSESGISLLGWLRESGSDCEWGAGGLLPPKRDNPESISVSRSGIDPFPVTLQVIICVLSLSLIRCSLIWLCH